MLNRVIKLDAGRTLDRFTCLSNSDVTSSVDTIMAIFDFANRSDFMLEAAYVAFRYVLSGGKGSPKAVLQGLVDPFFITKWYEVGDAVNVSVLGLIYTRTKLDIDQCREEDNGFYHNERALLEDLERFFFKKPHRSEVELVVVDHILNTIARHDSDQRSKKRDVRAGETKAKGD